LLDPNVTLCFTLTFEGDAVMELQSVGQVSKLINISVRTLHYYEQIGLVKPAKNNDNAYRMYDENIIIRLRQIIVLRKLRIPLKQISEILNSHDARVAIDSFERSLSEIDSEITALTTIRSVIAAFIERLNLSNEKLVWLEDENLLEIVDSLTISKIKFKEEKVMEKLDQAEKRLNKLTDRDVRIVYLPPSDVAAYRCEGTNPEGEASEVINKFVKESNLLAIKPDIRHYGFNAPNPIDETNFHGYEMWVTIPDGFDVPVPFMKKRFEGGLYCAHMIPMGAFDEWALLSNWLDNDNMKYQFRGAGSPDNMFDSLEETLNYAGHVANWDWDNIQLDLLIPIKEHTK
jgi:DNA-binding transcriptional MerR regulator